ncbi:MAG: hypothetical protein IJN29_13055 [Akkermansia sp.]|nr:hypothetical protein [Akkermansia sp.]
MQDSDDNRQTQRARVALLCLLASLGLHVLGGWLLLQLPGPEKKPAPRAARAGKVLQITREKKKKEKAAPATQKEPPQAQRPVVKTNSDRPEQRPEKTEFQGNRNTRAEGEGDKPRTPDNTPVPTMLGEQKKELNTVERERQDGPVEHERKNRPTPAPPPTPEPAPGIPDLPPAPQSDTGENETTAPAEAIPTTLPLPKETDGAMKLRPADEQAPSVTSPQQAAPPLGSPESTGNQPIAPRPKIRRPVYDPTLADHSQPGFRTTERRSRSTGQFVLGRNPALNVSATPMGRYEMMVYRLIAARWYAACDDHRGDIIPGRIIIAFRLNKRGQVETMNLVTRRGASVIQQGFTFRAIRNAQLPPMPLAVQRELIGEQLELIFTFNFD